MKYCDLVQNALAVSHLGLDTGEIEQLVFEDIKKLRLVNEAVHQRLVVSEVLECPEHPVPDNEESTVILVQAVPVRSVVNLSQE